MRPIVSPERRDLPHDNIIIDEIKMLLLYHKTLA